MPAQDPDCCSSKPETLLQTHQLPEASATEPQTQGKLVTPTMPLCSLNMAEQAAGHGHLQGHPGDLARRRGAHPQPSEALRGHTAWTKIDPR